MGQGSHGQVIACGVDRRGVGGRAGDALVGLLQRTWWTLDPPRGGYVSPDARTITAMMQSTALG